MTLLEKIREATRLAGDIGRSRGSNGYALNATAVERLVDIEDEIDNELRAKDAQLEALNAAAQLVLEVLDTANTVLDNYRMPGKVSRVSQALAPAIKALRAAIVWSAGPQPAATQDTPKQAADEMGELIDKAKWDTYHPSAEKIQEWLKLNAQACYAVTERERSAAARTMAAMDEEIRRITGIPHERMAQPASIKTGAQAEALRMVREVMARQHKLSRDELMTELAAILTSTQKEQ